MKISYIITLLGISTLICYSLIQIFKFVGISEENYAVYMLFYIFLLISFIILPRDYPKVE